jgi:hypothetical protein
VAVCGIGISPLKPKQYAMFLLNSVISFVFGAVTCSIVERIWQRVERRVRVEMAGSFFAEAGSQEGVVIKATNRGMASIPPSKVCLFCPSFGSWYLFPERKHPDPGHGERAWLPDQERLFRGLLLNDGQAVEPFRLLLQQLEKELSKEDNQVTFRLVLNDSEKVLYDNPALGRALGKVMVKMCRSGSASLTASDCGLHFPPPKRWWITRKIAALRLRLLPAWL